MNAYGPENDSKVRLGRWNAAWQRESPGNFFGGNYDRSGPRGKSQKPGLKWFSVEAAHCDLTRLRIYIRSNLTFRRGMDVTMITLPAFVIRLTKGWELELSDETWPCVPGCG